MLLLLLQDEEQIKSRNNESDDDNDDYSDFSGCLFIDHVTGCRSAIWEFYCLHKTAIRRVLLAVLVVLYFVYFGYAMSYEFGDEGSILSLIHISEPTRPY